MQKHVYTSKKGFFGCPHRTTLFGSRYNPFGFHVESSVESVLNGTKRVLLVTKRVIPGTKKGSPIGIAEPSNNHFFLRVFYLYKMQSRVHVTGGS